jgi:hypothetical protein
VFDRGRRRRVTNTIVSAPASPCIDPGEHLPFLTPDLRSFLYVSPSRRVADIQGDLVVRRVLVRVGPNVYCIAVAISPSERFMYDCSPSVPWSEAIV